MPIHFDPLPTGALPRNPRDAFILADPYPLGRHTIAAMHGIIRAIAPPPPAPQLDDLEERVEQGTRRILPYMSPLVVKAFIAAVHLLDWAPVWTLTRLKPLRAMSREEGAELVSELASRHNLILDNLLRIARSALLPVYMDQDEVHEALGYDVRSFMAGRIALRKRFLDRDTITADDMIGPYSEGLE